MMTGQSTEELEAYRREIDAFDQEIARLLACRLDVVRKVGEYKRRTAASFCPIRPGREASMLRRIVQHFSGTAFLPAAAAQLWRIIIGTSTALETQLTLSVFAPEGHRDLWWLAREYFGPAAMIHPQPHINRVIGEVVSGQAAVGIIPSFTDMDLWKDGWQHLLQPGADHPKIFAHLPFVYQTSDRKAMPAAFAFASVPVEASGADRSLFVLQASQDVSQQRLQHDCQQAGLTPHWLDIGQWIPHLRHHLIELEGFIPPEHPAMQQFRTHSADAVQEAYFLGAYAVPMVIEPSQERSSRL